MSRLPNYARRHTVVWQVQVQQLTIFLLDQMSEVQVQTMFEVAALLDVDIRQLQQVWACIVHGRNKVSKLAKEHITCMYHFTLSQGYGKHPQISLGKGWLGILISRQKWSVVTGSLNTLFLCIMLSGLRGDRTMICTLLGSKKLWLRLDPAWDTISLPPFVQQTSLFSYLQKNGHQQQCHPMGPNRDTCNI